MRLSAEYGRGGAQTTRRQAGRPPPALPAPRNRCVAPGTIASSDGARSKGPRRRVDPKHDLVAANDDQQHRRVHLWQQPGCQVWPAAARDDRANLIVQLRGRPQRSAGTGAGAEVADRQSGELRPACAQRIAAASRSASRPMSNTFARSSSSSAVSRSTQLRASTRLTAESRSELGAAPACRRSQPTPMHGGPDSLAAGSPSRSFNACSSSRENSTSFAEWQASSTTSSPIATWGRRRRVDRGCTQIGAGALPMIEKGSRCRLAENDRFSLETTSTSQAPFRSRDQGRS